jgi:hypothetical protein
MACFHGGVGLIGPWNSDFCMKSSIQSDCRQSLKPVNSNYFKKKAFEQTNTSEANNNRPTRPTAIIHPNALSQTGDKVFDGDGWMLFPSQYQSDHCPISMGCLGSRVNDSKILEYMEAVIQ